jgi:hypothetical protein
MKKIKSAKPDLIWFKAKGYEEYKKHLDSLKPKDYVLVKLEDGHLVIKEGLKKPPKRLEIEKEMLRIYHNA